MPEAKVVKAAPVVKALRITLFALLILYGLFFINGAVAFATLLLPPVAFKPFWGLADEIKIFLDQVLTGPAYFYIAYCVFKLIGLVSNGEPFSPSCPRYIRRIGYAVFCLGLFHATAAAMSGNGQLPFHYPDSVIRGLYSGLSALLVGFGFLAIAKVIEVGVSLKQDQDLTV